jgi:hypothetical protein
MGSSNRTDSDVVTSVDVETIKSDVAWLKRDIARLVSHLTTRAADAAKGVAREAADRSVGAVSRKIDEQPVISLLVAFGLGLALRQWLSR